ncbi:Hypothetical predicted protein [Mytilus galloprovincialis]|uniref:C-type lectin domain-containing protein n=2 Tax=Mytilus galloprovincialis TaxID=29158 RepID=A0A8B6ERF9_MYTGA|nr:Hypothetical predicted protein [Mytilus galloprovincialis]
MMIFFMLLVPAILAQDDVNSCPSNLIRNNALIAHNGYCYEFVINHNFDWQHAHGDCTSKGGHLVVVRSSADNLFLMSSLRSLNFHGDIVWIGLSDQKVEGTYEWPTGEQVTYTNWASGQPDLQAIIEDCIVMKYSDGGHWHDYSCFNFIFHHNNYPWICEYKQEHYAQKTTTTPLPNRERPATTEEGVYLTPGGSATIIGK